LEFLGVVSKLLRHIWYRNLRLDLPSPFVVKQCFRIHAEIIRSHLVLCL